MDELVAEFTSTCQHEMQTGTVWCKHFSQITVIIIIECLKVTSMTTESLGKTAKVRKQGGGDMKKVGGAEVLSS